MKKEHLSVVITSLSAVVLIVFVVWFTQPIPTASYLDWIRLAVVVLLTLAWAVMIKPASKGLARWLAEPTRKD